MLIDGIIALNQKDNGLFLYNYKNRVGRHLKNTTIKIITKEDGTIMLKAEMIASKEYISDRIIMLINPDTLHPILMYSEIQDRIFYHLDKEDIDFLQYTDDELYEEPLEAHVYKYLEILNERSKKGRENITKKLMKRLN